VRDEGRFRAAAARAQVAETLVPAAARASSSPDEDGAAPPRTFGPDHARAIALVVALALSPRAAAAQTAGPAWPPAELPRTDEHPTAAVAERATVRRTSRTGRTLIGAGLGFLAGTALGVAYGALGNPGLPHLGTDTASELEYTPIFAVAGAITGAVIANH
jgi:hypothetical protein